MSFIKRRTYMCFRKKLRLFFEFPVFEWTNIFIYLHLINLDHNFVAISFYGPLNFLTFARSTHLRRPCLPDLLFENNMEIHYLSIILKCQICININIFNDVYIVYTIKQKCVSLNRNSHQTM